MVACEQRSTLLSNWRDAVVILGEAIAELERTDERLMTGLSLTLVAAKLPNKRTACFCTIGTNTDARDSVLSRRSSVGVVGSGFVGRKIQRDLADER